MALTEEEELELLELENEEALDQSQQQPQQSKESFRQQVFQDITTPIRGGEALGVMGAKAIEGIEPQLLTSTLLPQIPLSPTTMNKFYQNLPGALERGEAATKPGFEPESTREAIGQNVAGAATRAGLVAPFGATGGAARMALSGGAALGGMEAAEQMAETGKINDYTDVILNTAFGMSGPILGRMLQRSGRTAREVGKVGLKTETTLPPEAIEMLAKNPNLPNEVKGSVEAINKGINRLQKVADTTLTRAGKMVERVRSKFGIKPRGIEEGQVITASALKDVPEEKILAEYNTLVATKGEGIGAKEKIKRLYNLRENLNARANFSRTAQDLTERQKADVYNRLSTLTNKELDKTPGAHQLRRADKVYSAIRQVYDPIQKKFSTAHKAQNIIEGIFRKEGSNPDQILGIPAGSVQAIRDLEKVTGEKILDPLLKEVAVNKINAAKVKTIKAALLTGGEEGAIKKMGMKTFKSANLLEGAGNFLKSAVRPSTVAALESLTQNRSQR